jgi:hypothetical protein
MEKNFKGKKFDELLRYVDYFTEGKKQDFFGDADKKENPKKDKKVNPFAKKGVDKKDKKSTPFAKKDTEKKGKAVKSKKGKIPPGLAAYLAKKKGTKNGSQSED